MHLSIFILLTRGFSGAGGIESMEMLSSLWKISKSYLHQVQNAEVNFRSNIRPQRRSGVKIAKLNNLK